ncbi:MAG: UpxY family transcription antiterminator [Verrucomicrobia bacterium]|nr:UpxY family transcription antiterminator [Verrucomicrobiota bacterium]
MNSGLPVPSTAPPAPDVAADLPWFVAHTRPRREKKLQQYCQRDGIAVTLPCYRTIHKYRGKTVEFRKPLFPGYVFLRLSPDQKQKVFQSDHVANLLVVNDQARFIRQLGEIIEALDTDLEIFLAPQIGQGCRVKIKSGALRGMEGWVEQRYGPATVLLRLDFIGQAAAVKLQADELELC